MSVVEQLHIRIR